MMRKPKIIPYSVQLLKYRTMCDFGECGGCGAFDYLPFQLRTLARAVWLCEECSDYYRTCCKILFDGERSRKNPWENSAEED